MAFVRTIGRWSLTALVINAIIGSSIFGLPSEITRLVGRASPLAMLLAAMVISLIVACMAEVASQFTEAGGGYLYVRTAFGSFAGLQVGWFWLLSCVGSGAASANLFVQYLSTIWPTAGHGFARIVIMTVLIAIPTTVNYFGVRGGANLSNILTVAKLLPLVLLIVLGLAHVRHKPNDVQMMEFTNAGWSAWLNTLLLLIFAYGGFEDTLAPSGEVKEPRRTVPFALFTGLLICAVLYSLIQYVNVATIGTRISEYPLADTASMLLRSGGAVFVAAAVMISTYGWLSGNILTAPRIVYSFAANGDAPAIFAKLHPRYSTPALALVVYSTLMWVFAVTGTFLWIAAVGGASVLILYSGVCASLIRLRKVQPEAKALRIPFGPVIAVTAIGISLTLISALNSRQALLMGVTALVATANWLGVKRQAGVKGAVKIVVAPSQAK
jgi:basic amino acid/polyamine antiporter, APA family